jgi:hypothetical protein
MTSDIDFTITIFIVSWLTLLGACLGSFLNVVVYRLPRGKSLSNPPSHCPKCLHPIRWYDNIPVFGWFMLRGKCRDCREPINVRYPIVEAVCGGIFCTISTLTLCRSGGDVLLVDAFRFILVLSVLNVTFFAAGLIEQENNPIPLRLFIPVAVLIAVIPFSIRESFYGLPFAVGRVQMEAGVMETLFAVFGNVGASFVVSIFFVRWIDKKQRTVWGITAVLLGFYLGIAGAAVVLLTSFLLILTRLISLQNVLPPNILLTFLTFFFMILILL